MATINDRSDVIIELNSIFKGMNAPLLMACLTTIREKYPQFCGEDGDELPVEKTTEYCPFDGDWGDLTVPETIDISGKDPWQLEY